MVFFNIRKRRGRPAPQKPKPTSFATLPDELHLKILDQVSTSDVLKLRATSKVFVGVCSDVIRTRLKVLYVHPSTSSLRKAIKICQTDLASKVEEICFLNKIMWHTICQQQMADRHLEGIDIAATWPVPVPKQIKAPRKVDRTFHHGSFALAHHDLLSALANLPAVRAFSFADTCDRPGFNMLPRSRILQPVVLSREYKAESKLYHRRTPTPVTKRDNFTDSEAVLSILSHPKIHLTKLRITDELPYSDEVTDRCTKLNSHRAFAICQAKLSHLTSIELHINTGWDRTSWQETCHAILSLAAPKLQYLKLAFQHNASIRRTRTEISLFAIFAGLEFPSLTHLDLTALYPKPERGRHYRPIIQDFDMITFLTTHSTSIRTLHFSNILFSDSTTPRPLLQQTRELLRLCAVLRVGLTWIVNFFTHDPRCEAFLEQAARCQNECHAYSLAPQGLVWLGDVRALAEEVGVGLDEERGVWDFGRGRVGGEGG